MPSRSQRHLREFRGLDSAGLAGAVALAITSPSAGANTSPVDLAATAVNEEGKDIAHLVQWSSDLDGALGGNADGVALTAGTHTLTASVGGASATVEVTI